MVTYMHTVSVRLTKCNPARRVRKVDIHATDDLRVWRLTQASRWWALAAFMSLLAIYLFRTSFGFVKPTVLAPRAYA